MGVCVKRAHRFFQRASRVLKAIVFRLPKNGLELEWVKWGEAIPIPEPDMIIPTEKAFRVVKYCVVTVMEGW